MASTVIALVKKMLDIGMHDSTLVRNSDSSKQVKSYPLSQRKRGAT
jgi:hypothetical protein